MRLSLSQDALKEALGPMTPTEDEMRALGVLLEGQVDDRFRTGGLSGSANWPPRRLDQMGGGSGRALMTGRSAALRESFKSDVDIQDNKFSVSVYSDVPYAGVHQQGTTKYGGPIPTIKPKTAKALFIPITDRAAASERVVGIPAAHLRRLHGRAARYDPLRVATRGRRITLKQTERRGGLIEGEDRPFAALKRGRIKDGRLEVYNERRKKFETGIPDFIFLSQVDIPPRPMLPDGQAEKDVQLDFLKSITTGSA